MEMSQTIAQELINQINQRLGDDVFWSAHRRQWIYLHLVGPKRSTLYDTVTAREVAIWWASIHSSEAEGIGRIGGIYFVQKILITTWNDVPRTKIEYANPELFSLITIAIRKLTVAND